MSERHKENSDDDAAEVDLNDGDDNDDENDDNDCCAEADNTKQYV